MVTTVHVGGVNCLLDVDFFYRIVEDGTDAEKDALFESIAAASPDELAPFFGQEKRLDEYKFTALMCAVHLDSLRFVRLLVHKGADHTVPHGNEGITPLMLAARHTDVLCYFLQELNCTADIVGLNEQDNCGYSALHCAIDNPQAVELLLEHGADPNIRSCDGTPLNFAARDDLLLSATVLWKYGAGATDVDDNGRTVLMVAAASNSIKVLRHFLQELNCTDIVNLQDHERWTALHCAGGNLQAVELLLEQGADPNIRNDQQATPLHEIALSGNTQSAALLLTYGADLSLTDHLKRNAMHRTLDGYGSTRFVQWLLDNGAEDLMFAKDQLGRTPLDEAVHQGRQPSADLLVQQYKTKIAAQEGDLCLHWILTAAIYKRGKVALPVGTLTMGQMLTFLTLFVSERPHLISTGDDTGALPLHIACQYPKTPIQLIEFLVEQDPSTVRQTDNAGNLPIHRLCASRPSMHKVKYLLGRREGSVAILNHHGRSPFEEALLASASLDVLWYLMKVDPGFALASLRVFSSSLCTTSV